jgi:alkane 1-monooxygenase
MQLNTAKNIATYRRLRHIAFCFLPHIPIALLVLGVWLGGYYLLLPTLFLQIAVPLLDLFTGWKDSDPFQENDFSPIELSLLQWNTRLYALFYMALVIWLVSSLERFTLIETGLLVPAMSLITGVCFAACHELMHTSRRIDYFIQKFTTIFLFYPHYKLIHTRNHHPNVGTKLDENTAWFNENIYAYLLRTVLGSAARCWQIEARTLAKEGKSGVTAIIQNQMFGFAIGQVLLLLALYLLASKWGLLFYLAHTIGGHVVLESVNFIQHYGLLRQEIAGKYEKINACHSWDTYHLFSSYATFRVGHHSTHHLTGKPYYLLGTERLSPKLPMGYFLAIPILLLPPCWRLVINPIIKPPA